MITADNLLLYILVMGGIPALHYFYILYKHRDRVDIILANTVVDEFILSEHAEKLFDFGGECGNLELRRFSWVIFSIKVDQGVKLGSKTSKLIDKTLIDLFPPLSKYLDS